MCITQTDVGKLIRWLRWDFVIMGDTNVGYITSVALEDI